MASFILDALVDNLIGTVKPIDSKERFNPGSNNTIFAPASKKRSCGRVARLSSAKAATAVRIRSGPPEKGRDVGLFPFSFSEDI